MRWRRARQGRRERSYPEDTGATEDTDSHPPARPDGPCSFCGSLFGPKTASRVLVDAPVVAQSDAVVALGARTGHVPVEHVLAHSLRVALEGVPEAAATARLELPTRSGGAGKRIHLQQVSLV